MSIQVLFVTKKMCFFASQNTLAYYLNAQKVLCVHSWIVQRRACWSHSSQSPLTAGHATSRGQCETFFLSLILK